MVEYGKKLGLVFHCSYMYNDNMEIKLVEALNEINRMPPKHKEAIEFFAKELELGYMRLSTRISPGLGPTTAKELALKMIQFLLLGDWDSKNNKLCELKGDKER